MNAVQRKIESELQRMEQQGDFLIRRYDSYIGKSAEIYQEVKGNQMPKNMKRNLAICLDNMRELIEKKRFMEETYSTDVSFTNYAFDVISAIMPSLIAEEIASVQALERRSGDVFFMNFLTDRAKGNVAAGATMMDYKHGWTRNNTYASGNIVSEEIAVGDNSEVHFTGNFDFGYLQPGSTVTITTNDTVPKTMTGTVASGSDTVTLTGQGTSSCNKTTGAFDIIFSAAPATGKKVTVTYKVDLEKERDAIGRIKVEITKDRIDAETYKLDSEWLMDAAYDLMKAHGKDAEKEILVGLTAEVKAEIDRGIILDIYNGAGDTGTITWNKRDPSGVPHIWHKESILDKLAEQSEVIYSATGRALGNFLLVSSQVHAVMSTLQAFKAESFNADEVVGSYFAGVLKDRYKVFVSPDLPDNKWVMGYKGDSFLRAGYVYAPYIPLFTTPSYTTSDFVNHKGLGSSFGVKMINEHLYSVGTMVDQAY